MILKEVLTASLAKVLVEPFKKDLAVMFAKNVFFFGRLPLYLHNIMFLNILRAFLHKKSTFRKIIFRHLWNLCVNFVSKKPFPKDDILS